jgi:hypothetical protein
MKRLVLALLVVLLVVVARAEPQPAPEAPGRGLIRVESQGNQLIAMREAPVAYTSLEEISASIGVRAATRPAPVRVIRTSPPEQIDYLFCVTSSRTLVLGERVHTQPAGARRYVFARGLIVRSYPALSGPEGWRWLVDVPLSRERTVTLQLRAGTGWPLESVSVTMANVP